MNLEALGLSALVSIPRGITSSSARSSGESVSLGVPGFNDGFGYSQDYQVSALAASGHVFLGRPTSGFGARGLAFEQAPRTMVAAHSSQQAQSAKLSEQNALSRKFNEVMGKVMAIAEKLQAVKVPGLSHCITLVNSVAGALEAGIDGDWEKCANQLLKAGKAAMSIAKSSGKKLAKVAGRSLPGISVVLGAWGTLDSKDKANAARRKGCPIAAALWEVKGLCDSATAAMGLLQIVSAPTIALPAGIEAGILALSLVSELVADAADDSEKEEGKNSPPAPLDPSKLSDLTRVPADNTRVVRPPVVPAR